MATVFQQILRHSINVQNLRMTPALRLLSSQAGQSGPNSKSPTDSIAFDKETLSQLVRTNKVVVFMKGNPEAPRCGFSNAVVQIMRMHGVQYDAHDVLMNDELRQAIKDYTDWPTIPQVFINGEFVGGCDILLQMHQSGDLIDALKKAGIVSELLKKHEQEAATKETTK